MSLSSVRNERGRCVLPCVLCASWSSVTSTPLSFSPELAASLARDYRRHAWYHHVASLPSDGAERHGDCASRQGSVRGGHHAAPVPQVSCREIPGNVHVCKCAGSTTRYNQSNAWHGREGSSERTSSTVDPTNSQVNFSDGTGLLFPRNNSFPVPLFAWIGATTIEILSRR